MKKKLPVIRRCCVVMEMVEPDLFLSVIVYSNFKITLEYINKKYKLKGKNKLKYSTTYRKLSAWGQLTLFEGKVNIFHSRINTNLNIPHKQLTIK